MRILLSDVLDQLSAEGLAPAGTDEAVRKALRASADEEIPWFMRALVGVGAWVATAFLLGALFGLNALDDELIRTAFGFALVVGAVVLRRQATSEFVRQATVAASLAGQGLIIAGIAELFDSKAVGGGVTGLLLSVALVGFMPDRLHRFLSVLIGTASAVVALLKLDAPRALDLVSLALVALAAYVWRIGIRDRDETLAEMLEPVGYGLIGALFGVLLYSTFTERIEFMRHVGSDSMLSVAGPVTTIAITLALVALVLSILKEHRMARNSELSVAAIGAAVVLGAGTLSSPGILAGVAVLVLGFDRRRPVLMGMAVAFLLVFGSVYYYSLTLTLLEKSGVLVGSGLLCLVVRRKLAPGSEEVAV